MRRNSLVLVLLVVVTACGDDDTALTTTTGVTTTRVAPAITTFPTAATTVPPATTTTLAPTVDTAPLVAGCQALDMVACDLLSFFYETLEEESLALSCAGHPRASEFSQFCSYDDQALLGQEPVFGGPESPLNPGDHPLFDALYGYCGQGIGDACDVLCHRTPFLFDAFDSVVGVRNVNYPASEYKRRSCQWWAQQTGDDPFRDQLEAACGEGGFPFCDYLTIVTGDLATGYRETAGTCGGHSATPVGSCVEEFGFDPEPEPMLDELAEQCRGDILSCDDLRYEVGFVDFGTVRLRGDQGYQLWAQTCGLINSLELSGSCAAIHGGEAERDASGTIIGPGRVSVYEVRVGDCFETVSGSGTISTLIAIPCDRLHDHEVFALPQLVGGPGADFPGAGEVTDQGRDMCQAAFEGYVGVPPEGSRFGIGLLPPSFASWNTGDREVICWITAGDRLQSSVAGSGD